MYAVLDDLLVGAVLIASLGYAAFRLGPRSLRKRIVEALHLQSNKTQGACGGCDNCGSESSSAAKPQSEINVPVGKIGRRA